MTLDKAGKEYWDHLWENRAFPHAVNPQNRSLKNYVNLRFNDFFTNLFSGGAPETRLIEIGCAGSEWLPYFRKIFGFQVYGLDYSEIGCEQSEAVLKAEGVDGNIILGDFFQPPEDLIGRFDKFISFGVMEHFDDTALAIKAASLLLKRGGTIVTIIPNLGGVIGPLQGFLSPAILGKHKILGRDELAYSHAKAGLIVTHSLYFLSINLCALNPSDLSKSDVFKKSIYRGLCLFSHLAWMFERVFFRLPPTAMLSPYIVCVANKQD
jgi:SAM-dependent methyltransferase